MFALRSRHFASAALLTLALMPAGWVPAAAQKASGDGVMVTAPWARATPGTSRVGVAFLEIFAGKAGTDKLVSASSPIAGVVELHTHMSEGGVMRMRRIEAIEVPATGKAELKPGGHHLMLMELKEPLKEGDSIDLTLVFEKAGKVKVTVPVLKVGSPGPAGKASGAANHSMHGGAHGKH